MLDLRKFIQEKQTLGIHGLQKSYSQSLYHSVSWREVVGNKTLLLTVIMELVGIVLLMAFDAPSITPSSCSKSLVTKLKGLQECKPETILQAAGEAAAAWGTVRLHFACLTLLLF